MATTRIKDLSKTATTVNADANLVLDGNTGGTQKITRDNFRQDTADAFVAAPGTYNLAPINSGTGKIDATYLPTSSDTPKGAWNASTNTPTLADGSGTAGDYYDVTVAGSSDLGSGSITFTVGDVVKYDGTTWFKIDSVTNILDGVSTIDGAKAAIEIPDVGTDPSEVPLNQHLGSMAYQDADSVSMGAATVDNDLTVGNATTGGQVQVIGGAASAPSFAFSNDPDTGMSRPTSNAVNFVTGGTERVRIDSSGRVGIGTSSPGSFALGANELVVGDGAAGRGITVYGSPTTGGSLYFADGTTGTEKERGFVYYDHSADEMRLGTAATTRWTINSTGNLVAGANLGIDFGSTTGGTGTVAANGGLLDDYEFGTFTVTTNSDATGAITGSLGEYTKIGRLVNVRIVFTVTTNFTASTIGGLPFTVNSLGTGASAVSSPSVVFNDSNTDSPVTCNTLRSNTTVAFSAGTNVNVAHNPNTTNLTYRLQFSYHTDD